MTPELPDDLIWSRGGSALPCPAVTHLPISERFGFRAGTARGTIGACAALALLVAASRIFVIHHPAPVHPDEDAFMAGIGFPANYPVHHPGYPLWVGMGTLTRPVSASPYWSFAGWSLAASVAAPLAAFLIFRRFATVTSAWTWALALGLNPLMWFFSATALTYCMAGLLAVCTVLLTIRSIETSNPVWLFAAATLLAFSLLHRIDLLIQVGCVVMYGAWKTRHGPTFIRVAAVLATGLGVAAMTTQFLYGRADPADAEARWTHTQSVLLGQSVFHAGLIDGLLRNGVKIVVNLGWDCAPLAPLLVWIGWNATRRRSRMKSEPNRRPRPGVIAVWWLAPGLIFLAVTHVVQGYFLPLLGAVYLFLASGMERSAGPRRAAVAGLVMALLSSAQFLFYPWSAQCTGWKRVVDGKIAFISRAGLIHIDQRSSIQVDGDFWPTAANSATNGAR